MDPPAVSEAGRRLARSAGVAGTATLASRILGLVRDQVLAALFGAGNQMDAFVVAFRIPNLVRDLFAEGAMTAAFVPTFANHLTREGKPAAWRLGNSVLNALALVTGALVVAGVVFAPALVRAYAGSFAEVPGKLELTILLTRVMLPFLTLVAIAAGVMGMLNSLHHYLVPALAPAAFNLTTIACALLLVPVMPRLGWPAIVAIAIGTVLGGVAQVAVQWPALRSEGFRYAPRLDIRDPGVGRVLMLMGPGTVGLAATQVNLLVTTLLATSQGTGAASWLSYAFRLMYLPIGLFGVSIATAVLPVAARHAALEDRVGIARTLSRGIGLMLLLNVPATVGLVVLAEPIVRVLFERGQFQPADTAATARVVQFYAIGLVGYASARIATPVFYAMGLTRVPVVVSTASVALNVALSLGLVGRFGVNGLALATSVAALGHGAAAVWLLSRRLDGIEAAKLGVTLAKMSAAALVMALVAMFVERSSVAMAPGDGLTPQLVRLGAAIGSGLSALLVCARLLGVPELADAIGRLRDRVRAPGSA